jgi:hypothetical protein
MTETLDIRNLPESVAITVIPQVHSRYGILLAHPALLGEYIQIGQPITLAIKVDRRDITSDVIESMRTEIQTIRAESEMKVQQIEERIQSLLALPNGGEQ